ncbi:TIGR03619 family F420-dependent LLM class oxidoreductase [Geodermatophilus sabuli]|uniref:Probable F420-dependent oxidoreductase, Rv2161c family n=1 Tax=Geodermatophilus sabuli TaxID=1564158 RepID=A0A285E6H1_9ACTN|nr:TIGR03619 family F420-dependent LLM class oxidoreductase [Geodermatophilus sabuli]MBB3082524.1 putative F420-dependent oxidoreductase [Geodermatophilus sabuli]SNX94607.1 probable F420-dependent oxidoreductase, Rv2161c family [Geodermatophilus sabuli]
MKYSMNCWAALGDSPTADDYVALAQHMEALGYHGVWMADHVAVPTLFDRSQYPYPSGFPENSNWVDPFTWLAAIATCTKHVKLGTTVAIVPARPPVTQAQTVATLDVMSNGRFVYGIGLGWMEAEYDLLNVPFKNRGRRTNEYIRIMKQLWSGDTGPFAGEFYSHGGALLKPLPVQKPHPMLIVGGEGVPAFKRLIELDGDGLHGTYKSPEAYRQDMELLKSMMAAAGRDVDDLWNTMMCTAEDVPHALGNPAAIAELEEMGVKEIVFAPKFSSVDEGMRMTEHIADQMSR